MKHVNEAESALREVELLGVIDQLMLCIVGALDTGRLESINEHHDDAISKILLHTSKVLLDKEITRLIEMLGIPEEQHKELQRRLASLRS